MLGAISDGFGGKVMMVYSIGMILTSFILLLGGGGGFMPTLLRLGWHGLQLGWAGNWSGIKMLIKY